MTTTCCCSGSYVRQTDGRWTYVWGASVPGSADLLLREVLALRDPVRFGPGTEVPHATAEEQRWARSLCGIEEPVTVRHPDGSRDLVVGMRAPELEVVALLTVQDIAEELYVSKATVDSYRHRGHLPEPQVVKGRTPLWSRPIVRHWMAHRPGAGWRTDVHGSREGFMPERTLPISRARSGRVSAPVAAG